MKGNNAHQDLDGLRQEIGHIKELLQGLNGHQQKEVLSYEQTMSLLDCSRNTLDRLRSEGLIKVYRLRGRLYCKYSEIVAAIECNVVE